MKARVLALLLVLAIAPGLMEMIEHVVHYATYGDLADRPGDHHGDQQPLGVDDHGCSGTFHLGTCHGGQTPGMVAQPSLDVATATSMPPPLPMPTILNGLPMSGPELRPPIA